MTEILLPCPFCGGKAKLNDCLEIDPIMDENGAYIDADINVFPSWVECTVCGAMGESFDNDEEADTEKAIAAWNRRAQPENEPLTLDELRQMDGEPVWTTGIGANGNKRYWCLVMVKRESVYTVICDEMVQVGVFYQYGKTWLAYRAKPKEEHNETD